ncbi:MAG: PilZ domain-containing protein [Betaproteobacteria bacterium]|jgi:hypothetical protein|nr:MAG: PilZ domain-containing protein [Betaproteobacteria bacterium]
MKYRELRAEMRATLTRRGALIAGSHHIPCVVQDMSDNGLQIMCTRPLIVGQTFQFRCELFPKRSLDCMIEVVHVGEAGIGTKIVEVDERGAKLIQLSLQEYFTAPVRRWE